jgi:exodeoxyribonuclease V gamma subunit
MLQLHTGNRLETLAESLAQTLRQPLHSPLQPEVVMVQSQGMARWLKLRLAEAHGICANYSFPFPKLFCAEVLAANADGAAHSPLRAADQNGAQGTARPTFEGEKVARSREVMLWQILRLLPEMLGEAEFAPLNNYLGDATDVRKRYQLAWQIANLFDQYLVFRPKLVLAWDQGRVGIADPKAGDHAAWQAALWRRLREGEAEPHLATLWRELSERVRTPGFKAAGVPERISVFGISALPPSYLQILCALGAFAEVRLFLLQPSREYWGLIVSPRESERILRAAKNRDAAGAELHLEAGNRLLASLGNLGRDFLELVLEAGDWDEHAAFAVPPEDSLLHHIQADIFHLRERGREESPKRSISRADTSVRVHSCHSPLREVEVVYDHLLEWFQSDPTLTPRDVLVMTPDIESYAPFVQAVFDAPEEPAKRIPFSVADRGIRASSQVIGAFFDLLNLPVTRLEATHVLRLLEAETVRARFGLSETDLDTLRVWVRQTNIRWGQDAQQREGLGLPGLAENTWQQGLDRLLLGYAMAGGGERMFQGMLPFDHVEGGNAEVLGHFAEYLQRMFEAVAMLRGRRTAGEWEQVLLAILDSFFQPPEDQVQDLLLIGATLRELAGQAAEAGCAEPVDLGVILESLSRLLEEDRFGTGFITGGVTFCALKPMRSIPFRIICLIGMDDGAFPRSDRHLSFDLMAQHPRLGDRSLRADDRYLFLETLLSARERLHISYVGQSIRDNSQAPPSVLVSEVLDYIEQAYKLPQGDILKDHVLVRHRLQAFSPAYFTGEDTRLFSYSAENCRASECGLAARVAPAGFLDVPLSEPQAEWRTVDVGALAEFFCNPARWLVTRRLGLRFEEKDEALEEVEPFAVGPLDGYAIRQDLVGLGLKGASPQDGLQLLKAAGRLPLGEAGAVCFRGLQADVQAFLKQLQPHLGDGYIAPVPIDHTLGGFRLTGEIHFLTARGLLHYRCASIKAKDLLRLWVQHLVLNAVRPADQRPGAVLVGREQVLSAAPLDDAPQQLTALLNLYWKGLTRPLKFFPRTACAFAEAALKQEAGEGKRDPAGAARLIWEGNAFKKTRGERENAYFDLCFRHVDPLDEEFQETAGAVFDPLLRALKEVACI